MRGGEPAQATASATGCGGRAAGRAPPRPTRLAVAARLHAARTWPTRSSTTGAHWKASASRLPFCSSISSAPRPSRKLWTRRRAHALMGRAIEVMVDEVHRYEDTVNQFLGDGVMALFGAPIAHEDHARRAVQAALAMQRALQPLDEELRSKGRNGLQVRQGTEHWVGRGRKHRHRSADGLHRGRRYHQRSSAAAARGEARIDSDLGKNAQADRRLLRELRSLGAHGSQKARAEKGGWLRGPFGPIGPHAHRYRSRSRLHAIGRSGQGNPDPGRGLREKQVGGTDRWVLLVGDAGMTASRAC